MLYYNRGVRIVSAVLGGLATMSKLKRKALTAAAVVALISFGTAASASTVTYLTAAGSVDPSNEAISGEAIFTLNSGSLTVELLNLEANVKSAAQLLSGISFTASGASGSGPLTTVNSGLV